MNSETVPKIQDQELPIPEVWKAPLRRIADALVIDDTPNGNEIKEIPSESREINIRNLEDYPEKIGPPLGDIWKSTIHVCTRNFWQVLVDLSTEGGGTSDLLLHVRVREIGNYYEFEPGLIYAP